MPTSLESKKALVTGSGTRLGKAFAMALAEQGCDVVVHYCGSEQGASETVAKIESLGRRAIAIKADFCEAGSAERLADEAQSFLGGIDILVNNASCWPDPSQFAASHRLETETLQDWEQALAIDARAPFFLIQALSKGLKASGGQVISILDSSIEMPYLTRPSHTVAKHALLGLTKLAAASFKGEFRVNALCLGSMLPHDGVPEEIKEKHNWGGEENAVSALLFALQNEFVSGEVISVRGDIHIRSRN